TPAHRRWPVSFTPESQKIAFSVPIASQIGLRAPCGDRIALGARPDRFHRDKKQSEVADCSNRGAMRAKYSKNTAINQKARINMRPPIVPPVARSGRPQL